MMLISALTTLIAIAAVAGVIAYRLYQAGGSAPPATGLVMLPKGARVIGTAVAGDRIIVTLEIAGLAEIRTFDAKTLKPSGKLKFTNEP